MHKQHRSSQEQSFALQSIETAATRSALRARGFAHAQQLSAHAHTLRCCAPRVKWPRCGEGAVVAAELGEESGQRQLKEQPCSMEGCRYAAERWGVSLSCVLSGSLVASGLCVLLLEVEPPFPSGASRCVGAAQR